MNLMPLGPYRVVSLIFLLILNFACGPGKNVSTVDELLKLNRISNNTTLIREPACFNPIPLERSPLQSVGVSSWIDGQAGTYVLKNVKVYVRKTDNNDTYVIDTAIPIALRQSNGRIGNLSAVPQTIECNGLRVGSLTQAIFSRALPDTIDRATGSYHRQFQARTPYFDTTLSVNEPNVLYSYGERDQGNLLDSGDPFHSFFSASDLTRTRLYRLSPTEIEIRVQDWPFQNVERFTAAIYEVTSTLSSSL